MLNLEKKREETRIARRLFSYINL